MSSTYLSLHYHLVFSTKNREALIAPEWRGRLHDYLGGTVRGLAVPIHLGRPCWLELFAQWLRRSTLTDPWRICSRLTPRPAQKSASQSLPSQLNCHGSGGFPEGIGGVADHVHLLVGLKATHCLSDFMRELKKASSTWVHEEIALRAFAWQEGYGAFTVSATAGEGVKPYIANQEEHHRVKSFREDLMEMLNKAGIEYEPKYLD